MRLIIGQNGYCSCDIYLQLRKTYRSVMTLISIPSGPERSFFIGCYGRAALLINLMEVANVNNRPSAILLLPLFQLAQTVFAPNKLSLLLE